MGVNLVSLHVVREQEQPTPPKRKAKLCEVADRPVDSENHVSMKTTTLGDVGNRCWRCFVLVAAFSMHLRILDPSRVETTLNELGVFGAVSILLPIIQGSEDVAMFAF